MQNAVALQAAQIIEKQLDQQLNELSNLQEDDIHELRKRRLAAMQNRHKQEQQWRLHGHGTYSEVADQKEWFEATKNSERVVCHFYRSTTWRCEIVDKHLTALAAKHIETRFIKINAEGAPFLAERFSIVVLPAIVLTLRNEKVGMYEGFDEFGGNDNFPTSVLEKKLSEKGLLDYEDPSYKPNKGSENIKKSGIRKGGKKQTNVAGLRMHRGADSDDDSTDDED